MFAIFSSQELFSPPLDHQIVRILFFSEVPGIRIILIESEGGVSNHGSFHMEPPITQKYHDIGLSFSWKHRRSTAQDLPTRPGFLLWNNNPIITFFCEFILCLEQCTIKLNGSHQIVGLLSVREVKHDGIDKVLNIDVYFDKYVQHLPFCLCDGYQAGMSIMNQQVTIELITSNIINAAGSICDISQNDCIGIGEGFYNVTYHTAKQHQPLRELQGHIQHFLVQILLQGVDSVDGFRDLEAVV